MEESIPNGAGKIVRLNRFTRRAAPTAAAIVALLPPAFQFLRLALAAFRTTPFPEGDYALLEMGTILAERGQQWLGPYSRFGWHHPGPAFFYLLIPFRRLLGGNIIGMSAGVLFLDMICAALILWAVYRAGHRVLYFWTGALLALYFAYPGNQLFTKAALWNPYAAIFPFAAFIFLSALGATGCAAAIPPAVLLGTFAAQTHIGYLGPAAAVGVLCAAGFLFSRRRKRAGEVKTKKAFPRFMGAAALLLAAALWVPPAVEQATNRPGNMTRISRHFTSAARERTWREARKVVAGKANAFTFFAAKKTFPGLMKYSKKRSKKSGMILQLPLMAAAVIFSLALRRVFLAWLGTMGIAAFMALALSVTRITGNIKPYLIDWIALFGFLLLLILAGTVGAAVAGILPKRRRPAVIGLMGAIGFALLAFASAGTIAAAASRSVPDYNRREAAIFAGAARDFLRDGSGGVVISIKQPKAWKEAAGIFLLLRKEGYQAALETRWLRIFGLPFGPTGRESRRLIFTGAEEAGKLRLRPGIKYLSRQGDICLLGRAIGFTTPAHK